MTNASAVSFSAAPQDSYLLSPAGFLSLEIRSETAVTAFCGPDPGSDAEPLDVFADQSRPQCYEVLVPGWLWASQSALPARLRIHWRSAGTVLAEAGEKLSAAEFLAVEISKDTVVGMLAHLAENPCDAQPTEVLVGALEHVYYGQIDKGALPPYVQDWLQEAARLTGLQAAFDVAAAPARAGPWYDIALRAFSAALAAAKTDADESAAGNRCDNRYRPAALLEAFYHAWPIACDQAEQTAFILAITPSFCAADSMAALCAALGALDYPLPASARQEAWAWSTVLPHLLCAADWDEAARLAGALATVAPDVWQSQTALAWCLRHAFSPQSYLMPAWLREKLVADSLSYLRSRAHLTEGPGANLPMREAMLLMLDRADLLSHSLRRELPWVALQCFGTSPAFWRQITARLDQGRMPFDPLRAGARAFASVAQCLDRPDGPDARDELMLDAALRDLKTLGVARIEAFRTEALGSYGTGRLRGPELRRVQQMGDETPERILRGLLDPLAPDLAPMPVDSVMAVLSGTAQEPRTAAPVSEMGPMIACMMRRAHALLVDPQDDGRMADLAPFLAQTSSLWANFAGIAAGLALIADLAGRAQTRARALELCRVVSVNIDILPKDNHAPMAKAPFMTGAARRLVGVAQALDLAEAPDLAALLARLPPLPHWAAPAAKQDAGLATAPALFDTVVMVCSCHANLDSRVAALRGGWLQDLKDLGIPHVILVGTKPGESPRPGLQGDVLQVASPDSYEALTGKILAGFAWLRDNCDAAHILKIDDDCHLDVASYFMSARHRCAPWYGRILRKTETLTDRLWHQNRAETDKGRLAFDRGPRQQTYTDGSTGYALDRRAVWALYGAARKVEGQRCIAGTFSEDVCVGALLGQEGLTPDESDYHCMILRRNHPGAPAVLRWGEGIAFNDRFDFTRVMHLDGSLNPNSLSAERKAPGLYPRRIWPADRVPHFRSNNGAMTLVSPESRLASLAPAPFAVIAVLRNERVMLPHFLAHYRNLGVKAFLFADNLSDDGSLEYLLQEPDVAVFSAAADFKAMDQGTAWKIALAAQLRSGAWSLVADVDELLLLPAGNNDIQTHLASLPPAVDAVEVLMRDMYPAESLAEADFTRQSPFEAAPHYDQPAYLHNSLSLGPFGDGRTVTSALRHRLMPEARMDAFVVSKIALMRHKPWMRFSTSLHYAADVQLAAASLTFAHFKYNAGFADKAVREVKRGQYWNDSAEYRAYLARDIARFSLYHEGTSTPRA